jgi:hypothetical protein
MQIEHTAEQKKYIELANLKKPGGLEKHSIDLWGIVRSIAVLDWAMLQPEQTQDVEHMRMQAEEKWRTICRRAHELAEVILEEQHVNNSN